MSELAPTTPVPVKVVPRYACPFYGFSAGFPGMMMDLDSHGCALKGDYHVCHMEREGDTPSFKNCTYGTADNMEKLEKDGPRVQIFPDEFRPEGATEWGGITLKQYADHVFAETTPRPEPPPAK